MGHYNDKLQYEDKPGTLISLNAKRAEQFCYNIMNIQYVYIGYA